MENIRKFTKNRILFVICTIMLAAICIAPFGFKPQNAYAACSHNWRDEKIMSQPTCTANGSKMQYCSKCYKRRTLSISKLGHRTNGSYTITKYATCGTTGTRVLKCTRCNAVLNSQTIPATGKHNWRENKVFQKATCTSNGSSQMRCTGCGQTKIIYTPMLEHHPASTPTVLKAATCTENGRRGLKCLRCGAVLSETIIYSSGHKKETKTLPNGIKETRCTICNHLFSSDSDKVLSSLIHDGCSVQLSRQKVIEALKYLDQGAKKSLNSEESAKMELIGKLSELGGFAAINDEMEDAVAVCEYIGLVSDLKKIFNSDTDDIERFQSTLSALSTLCGKYDGGAETIGTMLELMDEYCTPVLEKVEKTYKVRELADYAIDENQCPKIGGQNKLVTNLTLAEMADNYDEVVTKLRQHYIGIAYNKSVKYENLSEKEQKKIDKHVGTFINAKIELYKENYTSFEEYINVNR